MENKDSMIRIASIVTGVLIFGVLAFLGLRVIFSRATDVQPTNVVISETTANSAKITWVTDQPAIGAVKYGTTEGALNFYAPETLKEPATSHSVELTLLSPGSMYYFQIQIGDKMYDNAGVSWSFSTKSNEKTQQQPVAPPTVATTISPTPIQRLVIPDAQSGTCTETDCASIKTKLGQGCSTEDYFKCILKTTPTATPSAQ